MPPLTNAPEPSKVVVTVQVPVLIYVPETFIALKVSPFEPDKVLEVPVKL